MTPVDLILEGYSLRQTNRFLALLVSSVESGSFYGEGNGLGDGTGSGTAPGQLSDPLLRPSYKGGSCGYTIGGAGRSCHNTYRRITWSIS